MEIITMKLKKIEGVIFDLDGVITDTAEYHYLAWKQLGEELGIPFDREFNEKLKGVGRLDSLELILTHGNRQDDFTYEEKESLANQKNDHYVQLIKQVTPDDLLPGIFALLEELKAANLKIAIASASKNAFAVTKSLGVIDYFDHIVDAATVIKSKPDPEVFLKAAQAVGVLPENCIGIEDAKAGVSAIVDAGMFAVGIGDEKVLEQAHIVYPTTEELNLKELERLVIEDTPIPKKPNIPFMIIRMMVGLGITLALVLWYLSHLAGN
jgi:beta-phosphoglucomutase